MATFDSQCSTNRYSLICSFIHPPRAVREVPAPCQALRKQEGLQEEEILGLSECWSAQTSVPVPWAKALSSEFLPFLRPVFGWCESFSWVILPAKVLGCKDMATDGGQKRGGQLFPDCISQSDLSIKDEDCAVGGSSVR